jgi:hypothetical protein
MAREYHRYNSPRGEEKWVPRPRGLEGGDFSARYPRAEILLSSTPQPASIVAKLSQFSLDIE